MLVDVAPDAEILQDEIFGPVAPVVTWREEADERERPFVEAEVSIDGR